MPRTDRLRTRSEKPSTLFLNEFATYRCLTPMDNRAKQLVGGFTRQRRVRSLYTAEPTQSTVVFVLAENRCTTALPGPRTGAY